MTFRSIGELAATIVNRLEENVTSKPYRISEPGIFANMSIRDYFADPCPTPSLTQSIAKILIDKSPRHAWAAHPRLNPEWEADEPTKFIMGNAAHWHLIGRGKDVVVVEQDSWRSNAAKEAREKALAAGKIAVLREQFDRAGDMAEAALDQLSDLGLIDDWNPKNGAGEVVLAWREPGGFWYRTMIDWLPKHCGVIYDYKTTEASASPQKLPSKMADDGWCIQAAMHERGLNVLDLNNVGRRKHRFVCQECEYPYALTVTEITEAPMTIGRKMLAYADERWRICLDAGTHREAWPGYGVDIQRPEMPSWAETRWLNREIEHEERRRAAPALMPPV